MKLISAVMSLVLLGSAASHYMKTGSCPNVTPEDNFTSSELEGKWYVLKNVGRLTDCMALTFEETPDGYSVSVSREPFFNDGMDTKATILNSGTITRGSEDTPAKMNINWPSNIANFLGSSTFTVTSLNAAEEYAVFVECQRVWILASRVNVLIVSKNTSLPEDIISNIETNLKADGIKTSALKSMDQSSCLEPGEADFNIDVDNPSSILGLVDNDKIQTIETVGDLADTLGFDINDADGPTA